MARWMLPRADEQGFSPVPGNIMEPATIRNLLSDGFVALIEVYNTDSSYYRNFHITNFQKVFLFSFSHYQLSRTNFEGRIC